ncbi:hypothetical protein TWF106_002133 [Orbilia oligospora]|uniref:F-box domain-containing protein n=1 Tax=Orbilia oligospora TaxID=2813651 RepID=A0A6G1M2A7_ORBOL|nr:hypothetical protein TWF788_010418 [Orbilia oligospora]KAF3202737.1 hypothetical protein TWF679_010698 [Orbilia oligospora]KAF3225615.1 hypothetical protein TWF106_002133 [Orbilia oligospora]KAF3226213.1 hypothetical protein TWF191_004874 [Orbilia oligospora]KAF3241818.1 hypothetical protein TWF192_008831 [Orbilia oligospora]
MALNILSLPTEVQAHILSFLPWHDHFLASSVCPLWLSILRTESFRRQRHHGISPPNAVAGKSGDRTTQQLSPHGLLEHGLLRIIFQRERDASTTAAATTTSKVLMALVEKVRGHVYNYDCKLFDIGGSGLLETDVLFFGLKDKEPGTLGLLDEAPLEYHGEDIYQRDTSLYWTIRFRVVPWIPRSEYEASPFGYSMQTTMPTPNVKIPPLKLRRHTWESKEGTLKNFIGALRGQVEMMFFKNPDMAKCVLDLSLRARDVPEDIEKRQIHVAVKVKKKEEGGDSWGVGDWAKGFFWKKN